MEPSLAGTTTGANVLSVVASVPTAKRRKENVGTKEETTEIGLPCDADEPEMARIQENRPQIQERPMYVPQDQVIERQQPQHLRTMVGCS